MLVLSRARTPLLRWIGKREKSLQNVPLCPESVPHHRRGRHSRWRFEFKKPANASFIVSPEAVMTRCLAPMGWYIWWVIGMPSCKEQRETWEWMEWGGSRRNSSEEMFQQIVNREKVNFNDMCWDSLLVLQSFISPLSERLRNWLRSWYTRSKIPDNYRQRVQAQVFMQRQHLICITLL